MNIGDTVKLIKKDYPSVTISRIRFLEKEGLIKPKRSKGGTRSFTDKDIIKIVPKTHRPSIRDLLPQTERNVCVWTTREWLSANSESIQIYKWIDESTLVM